MAPNAGAREHPRLISAGTMGVVIPFSAFALQLALQARPNRRRGTKAATFLPGTVTGRAEISA